MIDLVLSLEFNVLGNGFCCGELSLLDLTW